MVSSLPRRLLVASYPPRCQSVFLTFDDGPHPEHTPRLLDGLRQHGMLATFFVLGTHVQDHPEIVQRIVAEGHAVGNHTWNHPNPAEISARELMAELQRTNQILKRTVGVDCRLFRPPHGRLTATQFCRVWSAGQTVVLWNVDPKDYCVQSADALRDWFACTPLTGGDLVLLHDSHRHAADALHQIAFTARERQLQCRRIVAC